MSDRIAVFNNGRDRAGGHARARSTSARDRVRGRVRRHLQRAGRRAGERLVGARRAFLVRPEKILVSALDRRGRRDGRAPGAAAWSRGRLPGADDPGASSVLDDGRRFVGGRPKSTSMSGARRVGEGDRCGWPGDPSTPSSRLPSAQPAREAVESEQEPVRYRQA